MKSRENELALIYLFFELIILNLSILLLKMLKSDGSDQTSELFSVYFLLGNLSWMITYLVLSKKNLYLRDGFLNRIIRITYRAGIFLLVSIVINFLVMPREYSRNSFLEYSLLFYINLLIFYGIVYRYLRYSRNKGLHVTNVLIAGISETTLLLKKIIQNNPVLGYKFVGFIDKINDNTDNLGLMEDLPIIMEQNKIQMFFVSSTLLHNIDEFKQYLKICKWMGVRLRIIPDNRTYFEYNLPGETIGSISIINPQEIPLDHLDARLLKRIFDLAVSTFVILFIFSWLFPIIALLLKFSSKGPIFFVQKRTGINNKTFKCIKFRSMQVNTEADYKQATANDPRITRIGRFMRKTNMDELPQFLNVFVGQMSVVGPRPHMLKHTDQYSKLIEHYRTRHYIKPGITGWAQVNGLRGETDQLWKMEKRVEYDMEYIEKWTFGFDIKIIIMTVFDKCTYLNAR